MPNPREIEIFEKERTELSQWCDRFNSEMPLVRGDLSLGHRSVDASQEVAAPSDAKARGKPYVEFAVQVAPLSQVQGHVPPVGIGSSLCRMRIYPLCRLFIPIWLGRHCGSLQKCVEEDVKRSKKWARFCSKCKIKFHAGEYFHHIHDCDGLKSRFLPSQPANIFDPRQGVKRQLVMAGDGTIKKLKIEEMAGRKSHIKLSKSFKVLKVLKGANNVPGAESGGSGSGPKVMVIKGPLLRRKCSDYSLSTRKRVKCTWCNKNMFENFYNLHKKRKHLWGEFRCPECAVEMFFPKDLVEHIKHHENPQETSAECPICHQKCPFEIMEAHYKSCVAEKETDVICDFCSQHVRFSNERGHNMKKHRYYGQFECPTCRIQADFAKDLAVHFRSTGHGSGRRFNRK